MGCCHGTHLQAPRADCGLEIPHCFCFEQVIASMYMYVHILCIVTNAFGIFGFGVGVPANEAGLSGNQPPTNVGRICHRL